VLDDGVRNMKVFRLFIGGNIHRVYLHLMLSQKRVSKEFYQPLMLVKTFENVFLVVQTTFQKKLTQSGLYNPDSSHGFQIL